jgi:hypothetical protein
MSSNFAGHKMSGDYFARVEQIATAKKVSEKSFFSFFRGFFKKSFWHW